MPLAEESIAKLVAGNGAAKDGRFKPWMALAVLPQAMNSFVVSLMNASKEVQGIGGVIESMSGERWGVVVDQNKDRWVLDSGRTAKKATLGEKWRWA